MRWCFAETFKCARPLMANFEYRGEVRFRFALLQRLHCSQTTRFHLVTINDHKTNIILNTFNLPLLVERMQQQKNVCI